MSMKDKKVKSIVESDEENEQGACGVSSDHRRFSLAVPEPSSGSLLDDSVDNLSMEVHLGGDSSRHPSEISSVSYQNLLDDGEPSSSIISRRGSDDSLDSYPPDFPDAELPPDDLETFEASDLPLSEHFPMGAIQGADHRDKSRGDRSIYVSDSSSNTSHPNVRLKDQPSSVSLENIKKHEKNASEPCIDAEEASAKRSSFEIRNNIPLVGEVKDYEKELNVDFSRVQGHRSTVIGLKQSPGVARRVEVDSQMDRDISGIEVTSKQCEISSFAAPQHQPGKLRPKKISSKARENVIEVITPIPRNMNIENEYDYVKYARVQQGNSYVGMRLAYSSSSDSLSIKQGVYSEDNSREPSPEKNIQQKIHSDHGSQEKVCEESLMEIPLNNSDYPEDKKAFTLSPENTECDSVEVESVTSEGDNSTPGFPTLEDGLSSSQASDIDEAVAGAVSDRSPSKQIKSKQKAGVDSDASKKDEDCRPKEMDAQAIMHDLKMKREALDMAIADIKSAIQRSKSMSLESSYSSQTEPEANQPVWVKRVNKETTANQAKHRQEEMRRVREEIERQQEELSTPQGKPHPEKDLCEREKYVKSLHDVTAATERQDNTSETKPCKDVALEGCSKVYTSQIDNLLSEEVYDVHLDKNTAASEVELIEDCLDELQINELIHEVTNTSSVQVDCNPSHSVNGLNSLDSFQCNEGSESISVRSSQNKNNCDIEGVKFTVMDISQYHQHEKHYETTDIQDTDEVQQISFADCGSENMPKNNDICIDYSRGKDEYVSTGSSKPYGASYAIFSLFTSNSDESNIVERQEEQSVKSEVLSLAFQTEVNTEQLDNLVQIEEGIEPDYWSTKESIDGDKECYESSTHINKVIMEREDNEDSVALHTDDDDDQVDGVRLDGPPRGYDSDDECEDAEGIRYTRRNKGKKYAPLQKDDSLEMGGACGRRDVSKSNGHLLSSNHTSYSGSSGSLANHKQLQQQQMQSGEQHIHSSEVPLSSEESSDIDANGNSYTRPPHADSDTDEETDRLLQKQYQERDKHVEIPELNDPDAAGRRSEAERRHSKAKEAAIRDPDRPEVLIEGVLFRARYLGSTQLISEGQPSKAMRMMQAQEAVGRIKAPEGENQPSTDVDLFVSTEKIMVLNTDLQEIMMDHSLRTISYIADIGDILVIMARRRLITSPDDMMGRRRRQAKILCHVFESDEAQLIAQSIGQAFQVAYLEFLKANGIEDPGLLKEMDYQDVLNQQEIYGEELNLFANKDFHKEVIVPKSKNEPLSVVIVESGWGSMVPTVVLANMLPSGPAARCGQLNIGDQIISINGISLVGLPLSACQTYIKSSRSQTVVKLTVVPCPPVVEVLIKRPDVKYQLGFSVQNGVICSLLRGGIAERGGVRVGHRIIEINNQSVVAVPHEKIVTLLASSVGEIHMKTMPTSIFRLLTGQDVPHYL